MAWVMERIRAISFRSPTPSRESGSLQISSSTRCRSSRSRQAVSRTSRVARHSLSTPDASAARVWGISWTSALPSPRCRLPRCGESLRARAICAPTPRPRWAAGTPARDWTRRWDASSTAAAQACTAAADDFSSSSTRNKSTSCESAVSNRSAPASAAEKLRTLAASCRPGSTGLQPLPALTGSGFPVTHGTLVYIPPEFRSGGAGGGWNDSNMCSSIGPLPSHQKSEPAGSSTRLEHPRARVSSASFAGSNPAEYLETLGTTHGRTSPA